MRRVGHDARGSPLGALGAQTAVRPGRSRHPSPRVAARLHADGERIDGVLHLVGRWRGRGGLPPGQTHADYRFLEIGLTALRHVTRAFDRPSRVARVARRGVVSVAAVARPLAGGANYAAVKAAEEAWARALAQGFAKRLLATADTRCARHPGVPRARPRRAREQRRPAPIAGCVERRGP
ncbi:MAG: hypothetical protein R2723_00105 [Microbacterium sp.]